MTIRLRPYENADWPELLALWVEAWAQARSDVDFSARAPWLAELFARAQAESAEIVIAEDREGLLGFVLFDPRRKWLEQIAVHPRAQGSGAARRLIARAKQACPEGFGLTVNIDNARARAFYRCEGFARESEAVNPLSGLPILQLRWTPGTKPHTPASASSPASNCNRASRA
jgi:putative acetyltransferase